MHLQPNKSKSISLLLCFINSRLQQHVCPFQQQYLCVYTRLCECLNMLPEGLSWLQFSRVGFAPCLRSWLTMLVCKRWEKHPHPFSLDSRNFQTFLGHFKLLSNHQCESKKSILCQIFEEAPVKGHRRNGGYSHVCCYSAADM